MTITTRFAPAGARMSRATSPERLATIDAMVQRARTLGMDTRSTMSGGGVRPRMEEPAAPPVPAEPTIPDRLANHDAILADHEARLVRVEEKLDLKPPAPPPAGEPAAASGGGTAAAAQPPTAMTIDTHAIYARHNEHRASRAAAVRGIQPPARMWGGKPAAAQQKPAEATRLTPPASCTAMSTRDIYARFNRRSS